MRDVSYWLRCSFIPLTWESDLLVPTESVAQKLFKEKGSRLMNCGHAQNSVEYSLLYSYHQWCVVHIQTKLYDVGDTHYCKQRRIGPSWI